MQKTITTLLLLWITSNNLFSQDFYITRRDFTDPNNYIHSLLELNQTNGTIINTYDYTSTFSSSNNFVESLTYNLDTKEIFGISDDLVLKYNIETGTESSFSLPILSSGDYQDIVIANNKLFVSRRDFTDPNNYIHSLLELNQINGTIINTYDYTSTFSSFNNSVESLTYNLDTKEIFGISDDLVLKYNIETGAESSFSLPALSSGDYQDIVIANNKLFVTRRDFTDPNNYIHSLLELNQTNGTIISTYDYTSTFSSFNNSVESLIYNAGTKEIFGISDNLVLKYNIEIGAENSFSLPILSSGDYGAIITTGQGGILSTNDFEFPSEDIKIVKTYNLLGQEVSINTSNEIIIFLFENGERKKAYNRK